MDASATDVAVCERARVLTVSEERLFAGIREEEIQPNCFFPHYTHACTYAHTHTHTDVWLLFNLNEEDTF